MQDLLEYISNSSVFAMSCSWRTDVTWLADASTFKYYYYMFFQFKYSYVPAIRLFLPVVLLLDYNFWGCMVSTVVWHLCCCYFCFSGKFDCCGNIAGVIFLLPGGSLISLWFSILLLFSYIKVIISFWSYFSLAPLETSVGWGYHYTEWYPYTKRIIVCYCYNIRI